MFVEEQDTEMIAVDFDRVRHMGDAPRKGDWEVDHARASMRYMCCAIRKKNHIDDTHCDTIAGYGTKRFR